VGVSREMSSVPHRGPRHRRRAERPTRRRFAGSAYWVLIGGAAAAIISSGFVMGAFVIGSFASNPFQSSAQGAPMPPPGVSYVQAAAEIVGPATSPASGACVTSNLGTLPTPTALTDGANTGICLSTSGTGFNTGDTMYIFEISFSHLAANATIFEVQLGVSVTPSANDVVVTSFLKTSAAITVSENATFGLDMTESGDVSIVSFGVLVTQL